MYVVMLSNLHNVGLTIKDILFMYMRTFFNNKKKQFIKYHYQSDCLTDDARGVFQSIKI